MRFYEIQNHENAENFKVLSQQQKHFISACDYSVVNNLNYTRGQSSSAVKFTKIQIVHQNTIARTEMEMYLVHSAVPLIIYAPCNKIENMI